MRTGVSARGAVYGPMAEVVYDSLQYLTPEDTRDGGLSQEPRTGLAARGPSSAIPGAEGSLLLALGKTVYDEQCAKSVTATRARKLPHYPPLAGNQSIEMASAVNPIRMVLNGGYPPGTSGNPMPFGMPPFAQSLSDDEVAAVVSYIRTAWGNHGAAVTARDANSLRSAPLD